MWKLGSSAQQHAGADHVIPLLRRARLDWLLHHFPPRLVQSVYVFINGFITIGVLALLALVSHNPFVFPSLGPPLICCSSLPSPKRAARETPFWDTPLGSSAVMGHLLPQAPGRFRLECTLASSGQES